jgi:hypothetical protein
MYHPVLRANAQRQLKKMGRADLVIGLPTYKNPDNAAHVAQIALQGAREHYPDLRTVLLNVDAGFAAATRRAVAHQATKADPLRSIITGRYEGLLGQGSAIAAVLDAALALDAKAIIILDSNTQTIAPHWIAGLAHLLFEDKADLILPRYQWSVSSPIAILGDLIIYPMFRALWGRSVRHPAAPDIALSPALATALLDEDVWETEVATFGFHPWLSTYSLLQGWRIAQSALGEKQDPGGKVCYPAQTNHFQAQFHDILSVMLRQVYEYKSHWTDVEAFYALSTLTQFAPKVDPIFFQEPDFIPLLDELALGWIEYRPLWRLILTPENLKQLETLAALPPDQFYFPPNLWARILYDFAVVFNKGECDPYQVVKALFPIYQGRVAAFWQEIAGLSLIGREGTVAAQAVELEEMRSYLKIRWHTYQPWSYNNNGKRRNSL